MKIYCYLFFFINDHHDCVVTDPTHVIGLFPDLLPSEFRKQLEYPAPPPPLTAGELEKGCLALVEYLTQVSKTFSLRDKKRGQCIHVLHC